MHLERIRSAEHPLYTKAISLYQISFPTHEQRETPSQSAILSDDRYHFTLLLEGDTFVGLLLFWEMPELLYIEHFCILPELRNKQYGQQALALLRQQNKLLLLEIDPPTDEISQRRKGFYERAGFVENPYPHIHPPYHAENEGHPLVVMTAPSPIEPTEYEGFRHFLDDPIMKDVFSV